MFDLPLHLAIVRVPLGIAAVLPLVAGGVAWGVWRKRLPRGALAVLTLLQVGAAGAALVAVRTGLRDEAFVAAAVPEALVDAHAQAGWLFLFAACLVMVVSLGAMLVRDDAAAARLGLAVAAGALLLAVLAVRVGHLGGQLDYDHDAAAAFARDPPPADDD